MSWHGQGWSGKGQWDDWGSASWRSRDWNDDAYKGGGKGYDSYKGGKGYGKGSWDKGLTINFNGLQDPTAHSLHQPHPLGADLGASQHSAVPAGAPPPPLPGASLPAPARPALLQPTPAADPSLMHTASAHGPVFLQHMPGAVTSQVMATVPAMPAQVAPGVSNVPPVPGPFLQVQQTTHPLAGGFTNEEIESVFRARARAARGGARSLSPEARGAKVARDRTFETPEQKRRQLAHAGAELAATPGRGARGTSSPPRLGRDAALTHELMRDTLSAIRVQNEAVVSHLRDLAKGPEWNPGPEGLTSEELAALRAMRLEKEGRYALPPPPPGCPARNHVQAGLLLDVEGPAGDEDEPGAKMPPIAHTADDKMLKIDWTDGPTKEARDALRILLPQLVINSNSGWENIRRKIFQLPENAVTEVAAAAGIPAHLSSSFSQIILDLMDWAKRKGTTGATRVRAKLDRAAAAAASSSSRGSR